MSLLSKADKKEISAAVAQAERLTSGEIRVHLKDRAGEDVLSDARKTFTRLGMQRTKHRNGVLIFVAPKSRRFAIVGDEGIHERVGEAFWGRTRDAMAEHFAKGALKQGILTGVRLVGEHLEKHFPRENKQRNELSNEVTEN